MITSPKLLLRPAWAYVLNFLKLTYLGLCDDTNDSVLFCVGVPFMAVHVVLGH